MLRQHPGARQPLDVGACWRHRLLGPNGSGKTTMIRTLLGLIPIDNGSGEVLDMDFRQRQLDIRRQVGFVPEDECLFPHVVGVEFVAYAGELVGMVGTDALQSPRLLWEVAAQQNEQIRFLRPQRSTLEEVFLNALERT